MSSPPPLVTRSARQPIVAGSSGLEKLSVVRASYTLPRPPSLMISLARATAGRNSWLWAHIRVIPLDATAWRTASAAATGSAVGGEADRLARAGGSVGRVHERREIEGQLDVLRGGRTPLDVA